jgi:predicted nucleic acid-binding protein
MIVLDTNVVSEIWRPKPSGIVVAWLDEQPVSSLYLCTPVLAELRYGVELLSMGGRKERLRSFVDELESSTYRGRILPLDAPAAAEFGRLAAERKRAGRRMRSMDGLIAAIALSNRAAVATRDVNDFTGIDLQLINPFEGAR